MSEVDPVSVPGDELLTRVLEGYPLGGNPAEKDRHTAAAFGLRSMLQPDRRYLVPATLCTGSLPQHSNADARRGGARWALHELVDHLYRSWCGSLTLEMHHLTSQAQQRWLVQRMESPCSLSPQRKRAILRSLLRADVFERFLAQRYPASKRFGLEGCEALVPGLEALLQRSAELGVQRVEIGMAHRGRLNLLHNILSKPLGALCSEMDGSHSRFHVGDVKYHLGQSGTMSFRGERGEEHSIRVSIAPNPSHLDAVGPVVVGMVRAEQDLMHLSYPQLPAAAAAMHDRVMPLLIHGDASLAGQGTNAELAQLAQVPAFSVGGTVHVVINNQVGFTTLPEAGRSSTSCTDVLRVIDAPVLHVNADDPAAVVRACLLASEWRSQFHRDVVVDIVGYRRFGHNEQDDPSLTMPLTYRKVVQHPAVFAQYKKALLEQGVVTSEELAEWEAEVENGYLQEYEAAMAGRYRETARAFLTSSWQGDALAAIVESSPYLSYGQEPTGLAEKTLRWVGQSTTQLPPGFQPHHWVEQLMRRRRRMVDSAASRVDWAFAEVLAFGTLSLHKRQLPPGASLEDVDGFNEASGLNRGHYHIRLTGQDVERGTFNQRHAILYDQATGHGHEALNDIIRGHQDAVQVCNSPLSEAAVLGFEYGYSLGCKGRSLVLWEAQFGDFANNAQAIIDQFIASGEEKWGQSSGLVMLLPHGYDGQGPDHSSARIERYLSLLDDDPDFLPGQSPAHRKLMQDTFEAISAEIGEQQVLSQDAVASLLRQMHVEGEQLFLGGEAELMDIVWAEMGLSSSAALTRSAWEGFMAQYLRRRAESRTNMFVISPSTPAQYFHALRRQANLPFKKPVVLLTSKYLLHHTACTSPLEDFCVGSFFMRVIDDGSYRDNTRTIAGHPRVDEAKRRPDEEIRRVVLCMGQVYYHLFHARRARRVSDLVLVRLEQIAPFPVDLVMKVVRRYPNAELVWCQEEPKNMGAWPYVRPRLHTALRELAKHSPPPAPPPGRVEEQVAAVQEGRGSMVGGRLVRYVGRPTSASPATASFAIHSKQQKDILELVLEGCV